MPSSAILPGEHHRGVEVRESRGRRRIGEVVGRHVHRLDGGDGSGLGRGDALLQHPHLRGQGGLVAHRRGHPPEQGRHLDPREGVTIDVVDKEQDVAPLVPEELRHGKPGQGHPQPVPRRLVHLPVDQSHLVEDAAFLHFVVEIVALPGPLSHPGEHRVAAVLDRDIADELHHAHGLADPRAPEEPDLAALGEGTDEVDNLDAGLQQLHRGRLVGEAGRLPVDRPVHFRTDVPGLVDRLSEHVHDPPQRLRTDWDRDGTTRIRHPDPALQAIGGAHRDRPHHAVAELLLHLEGEVLLIEPQRVIDLGNFTARELDVHDRADDLYDFSTAHPHCPRFHPVDPVDPVDPGVVCARPSCTVLTPRRRRPRSRRSPG